MAKKIELKPLEPLEPLEPLDDKPKVGRRWVSEMTRWGREMGTAANDAALGKAVAQSGTNIELLVEGQLVRRGAVYQRQVEQGYTRVDHLVLNEAGTGWVALFEDGDYWHADQHGHDYGKGQQLIDTVVDGVPVVQVVRMLGSELMAQPDWVIDRALAGEQVSVLS